MLQSQCLYLIVDSPFNHKWCVYTLLILYGPQMMAVSRSLTVLRLLCVC